MHKQKSWLYICFASLAVILYAVVPAYAATNTKAGELQSVAQSYNAAKALQQGIIVQLSDKNKTTVAPVSYKNTKQTFGVVVPANAAPVTLSSNATQQVYVVTSGRYGVLVSTQDGPIASGDYVAASAIDGIGMKADSSQTTILGRATSSFNGKSNVISSTKLKTSDGKQVSAAIGMVTVDIAVIPNPVKTQGENGVPAFIQSIAKSVVGKPISAVQLYASLAVLIMGLGVVASLLYSGIQTGMIAIGRNPLAKKSIMRNMIQVIVAGVMIFFGCLFGVYLILKL